ncbi:hypothetical protein KUTeg_020562 [Tegillarca granosa]|uniref:Pre-rRNA-processing protein TSR1 homolog n=1 Tax=Tegillarca granosa TaxID=220873 RepID=A0ABQ9EDQ1_TEGGR|nr:hypothetical protein KUTeg_020562 [Tegillarca granosa]
MAADSATQQRHRPGALKQQNKTHKHGKHKSKGQMDRDTKGRVSVKALSKKNKQSLKKTDRRHHAQQIRQQKREEILSQKRNRGTQGTPPHFVVIVPLHHKVNTESVLTDTSKTVIQCNELTDLPNLVNSIPRFKKRVAFYIPQYGNIHAILDAAKVADSLLCILSPDGGIDYVGDKCLTCIFGQGLPAVTFAVQGLKSIPTKKQNDAKKLIQKNIEKRFPSEKYHSLDTAQDGLVIMRNITNHKLKPIYFRELRPHMVAENIEFEIDDPEDVDMEFEDIEDGVRVLETVNPMKQTSLQSEVLPDPMEGEQTWPTEEELADAEAHLQAKKKTVKRVPKGTSEYQASWIIDSDEELTVTEADDAAKYDENFDMDEEEKMLMKLKEEKSHVMFPDEIDTPMDKTARTRFQRYLLFKYLLGHLLGYTEVQIQNGWYITVHISCVPKEFMVSYQPGTPVVVFGLLPHEQKMSVLNFAIRRCDRFAKPIKSKERLIFHVGFRRYSACPIFSQHTNSNKHKYERFLQHDSVTIATVFAPITFPPSSVLVFKEGMDGNHELVATGTLLSVNPDRIVVKRIVLSGYPFKINKKSAVVRYMFFNREDIDWFKPVELKTKWGRRGHIKEPLGTHGHMKCVFDGQLKSQDTILMNLYKRMFPKWTYNPHVPNPPLLSSAMEEDEGEEETEGEAYQMFD